MLGGIGGYGNSYVDYLLDAGAAHGARIVAAADPAPAGCKRLAELKALGVPVLPTLDEALEAAPADLVVLSTPISLHAPHACTALARGAHVLCEKPLCASLADARSLFEARARAGRQVAVGYQWSFCETTLALKRDILAGRFGAPRRLKTLVLWPRDRAYYHRNRWAGRQRDDQGRWVLDSPVNNAVAHHLQHMLFLLGGRIDRSLCPDAVTAELYRANAIENYDTAMLRARAANGAEILFTASHAVQRTVNPTCLFEFELATIAFSDATGNRFVARFGNGETRDYGSPDQHDRKLWTTIDCVRTGAPVPCGLEAAAAHTLCMLGAQQSSVITPFPASLIRSTGEGNNTLVSVDGMEETLERCHDANRLPSEAGVPWAKPGRDVALAPLFKALA